MNHLIERCKNEKYYQTIRFFYHRLPADKKKEFILMVAYENIFLASQCVMSDTQNEEIEIIMKEFQWDRDQTYKEAAKILDVNMEDSHVGMLGISQCRELIIQFRDMRGADI